MNTSTENNINNCNNHNRIANVVPNSNDADDDEADDNLDFNDPELKTLLDNPINFEMSRLRETIQHKGFDNNTGDTWIYPNNLPCRSYQMNITQAALYRNTLVVLPTGLGKTFIAAVIMYNIYRWYPCGKVIFMAPTRPLVNQQIDACQNIMPFPKCDIAELTGKLSKTIRYELWHKKRVFFVTPQVLQSDMDSPNNVNYPYTSVKLIVVDEAHRAKGRYAYVEVIQMLLQHTQYFRVLALTATPGRTIDDVAEVCRNLLISHIEVRWDTSIDVTPYIHKRRIETIVVKLSEQIIEAREHLLRIIDPYMRQLIDENVLSGSLANLNRNFLLFEQKRFRERCVRLNERHPHYAAINSNFSICVSLYHALELLEHHGLRVFLNYFLEDEDGKQKFVLQMDHQLRNLIEQLKLKVGPNPFDVNVNVMINGQIPEVPKNLDFGHPKFEKARECLKQHFMSQADSRAIVFCEFRESVMLMYRMLLQEKPLLRPRCFVGQGGGNSSSMRPLTQKQQLQVMNDFRKGVSNILIATSVGEEGIDVGEVELIVCFDINTTNPTRFVQRIGRTGRKKNGHVVMLVSEGREQQLLKDVLANKDQINKKLLRSNVIKQALYPNSPRLVPTEYQPQCMFMYIKPDQNDQHEDNDEQKDQQKVGRKSIKSKKKSKPNERSIKTIQTKTRTLKINTNQEDLRKFFITQNVSQSNDNNITKEMDVFDIETITTQYKPGIQTQEKLMKKLSKKRNLFNDLQNIENVSKKNYDVEVTSANINKSHCEMKTVQNGDWTGVDFNKSFKSNDENERREMDKKDFRDDEQPSTSNKCIKNQTTTATTKITSTLSENVDAAHLRRINKFLQKPLTTRNVLNRSQVNDLSYHLKSKEMSDTMKLTLLKLYPEFIRENLEKMQILQTLNDQDDEDDKACTNTITPEEKSIRLTNKIIVELFGSCTNIQDFLTECELNAMKTQIDEFDLDNEIAAAAVTAPATIRTTSHNNNEIEESYFQLLNDIFIECDNLGPNVDNYDEIMIELRKTDRYKDFVNQQQHEGEAQQQQNIYHQQSITYDIDLATWNDDNDFNAEVTMHESKYFDQWPTQYKQKQMNNNNNNKNNNFVKNLLLKPSEFYGKLQEDRKDEKIILLENDLNLLDETLIDDLFIDDFNLHEEPGKFLTNTITAKTTTNTTTTTTNTTTTTTTTTNTTTSTIIPNIIDKPIHKSLDNAAQNLTSISIERDLDENDELFMNIFPEEQAFLQQQQSTSTPIECKRSRRDSFKENQDKLNFDFNVIVNESSQHIPSKQYNNENGLIDNKETKEKSELERKLLPLIKLQMKSPTTTTNIIDSRNSPGIEMQTTPKRDGTVNQVDKKSNYEKSPSVFDMFLKATRGKCKLPKIASNIISTNNNNDNDNEKSHTQHIAAATTISDDTKCSPIIKKSRSKCYATKRIIFDSSDSSNDDNNVEQSQQQRQQSIQLLGKQNDLEGGGGEERGGGGGVEIENGNETNIEEDEEMEIEEIPATQMITTNRHELRRNRNRLRKRKLLNAFIQTQAIVSGEEDESHDDENDYTIGPYDENDSIIVSSNDEFEDEHDPHNNRLSTTHMHAIYLQSIKSPQQKRGGFKIPEPRLYNDQSHIFSQSIIPTDDIQSQYVMDSFVVDDAMEHTVAATTIEQQQKSNNETLSPLEKAERLLQERRKAKRKYAKIVEIEKKSRLRRRRIKRMIDDSCNEDTSNEET